MLVTAWASLKSFVPREAEASALPPPDDGQGKPPTSGAKPLDVEPAKQPKKEATQPTSSEPSEPKNAASMPAGTDADKKSRNEEVDFHGQKRSNETRNSTTDPEARLFRKGPGKEARLLFMGHPLPVQRVLFGALAPPSHAGAAIA